jgi:hypothetical protein
MLRRMNDAAFVMEQTLAAIAARDIDVVPLVFDQFFDAYPKERANFYVPEASYGRMINETIEILMGVALNAAWAPVSIARFVDLHRNYGDIPIPQYDDFVDILVRTLAGSAGEGWTPKQDAVWNDAALRLKALIAQEALRG